eukprot:CAMPEP_0118654804 /NCGR_PEP_ID=MMETSP0785-20121206/12586_1 /TAXON_ID=91992 /ORGANISM="Bolidomonas pacifica, Strain CCMP 1866" /LENGTH=380 /DNA_ID=CAMNT_0006547491 /DNA_START=110 /DNA_END=1252 /DNA_ORIENTATION=-
MKHIVENDSVDNRGMDRQEGVIPSERQLEFIGLDVNSHESILFLVLALLCWCCFIKAIQFGFYREHYNEAKVIKLWFPFSILLMVYDNFVMALGDSISTSDGVAKSVFVLHPFIVPSILMTSFEITYLVHKRRSVKFCGIQFDEGRRVKTTFKSWLLRNIMTIIATCLIGIGVVVNFDLVQIQHIAPEAGNVSWLELFESKKSIEEEVHKVLGVLPTALLILANFYFAIVMWRYGSNSSMIIHSSYLNPWVWQLIGTLGLAAGQFPKDDFKITSNSGEAFLVLTIIFLMNEVDKDMKAANEFVDFLEAIEDKTNSADEKAQIAASIRSANTPTATPTLSKSMFWGFGSNDKIPDLLNRTENGKPKDEGEIVEMSSIQVRL